jgi:hypothetical protein
MGNFGELMNRLVEIQSYETHRSPELIAEDRRLMNDLRKRSPGRKSPHTANLRPHGRVRERLRA